MVSFDEGVQYPHCFIQCPALVEDQITGSMDSSSILNEVVAPHAL